MSVQLAVLDIGEIATALRAGMPDLREVGTARDFGAMTQKLLQNPSGYVLPQAESPGQNRIKYGHSGIEVKKKRLAPHLRQFQEPLDIEAPETAEPLCCHMRTVIFYAQRRETVEIGRCDTRLQLDDILKVDGNTFTITSGAVAWREGAWVMLWNAR